MKAHNAAGYRRGCRCDICSAAEWTRKNGAPLAPGTYAKLEKAQDGVCAICGGPPKRGKLCIDHCHETGTIRGLLCHQCNRSIGGLGDQLSWILRAAIYLERSLLRGV